MIVYCVYSEPEDGGDNFHTGCYSSLDKANEAIEKVKEDDPNILHDIRAWQLDAPLEVY